MNYSPVHEFESMAVPVPWWAVLRCPAAVAASFPTAVGAVVAA